MAAAASNPWGVLVGALVMAFSGVLMWQGFRKGGSFLSKWPFPKATRDRPLTYWASAAATVAIFLVGLDVAISAYLGITPLIVRLRLWLNG